MNLILLTNCTLMKIYTLKILLILLIGFSLTALMSCEGPEGPTGPQGEQGPQGEVGPQGSEGNANVKRYIFDGNDFFGGFDQILDFSDISVQEFEASVWLVYLVLEYEDGVDAYPVPGLGDSGDSLYRVILSSFDPPPHSISILLEAGPGESYDATYVLQIPSTTTMDMSSKSLPYALPQDLDTSDYNAVMNYLGDSVKTIRY